MTRTIRMGRDLKKCRKERLQLQEKNTALKQQIENMSSFSRDRISTLRREGDGKLKSARYYTADGVLDDLGIDAWERLGDARRVAKQGAQKTQGGKRKTRKRRSRAGRKRRKKTKKKRHIITRKNKKKRRRKTKKRRKGGMPKGPAPKKSGLLPPNKGVIKPKHIRLQQLKKGLTRSPTVRNLQQLRKFKPKFKPIAKETEEQSKMDEDLDSELSNIFGNMTTPTEGSRRHDMEKTLASPKPE